MSRVVHARTRRDRTARRRRIIAACAAACALVLVAAVALAWALAPGGRKNLESTAIDWPSSGAAALAVGDTTVLSPGGERMLPMASITKLITALVVLDAAPVTAAMSGPSFPMTEQDVAIAAESSAMGGTTTPVVVGQVFSERQLLEFVLIASSNNLATTLARRVFGDEQAYLRAARAWLDDHGLKGIRVADASGMSPENVASARDLLALGALASANEVIAEISAQRFVFGGTSEPVANTNDLLALPGVTGLKTGHTDEAGYTALFVADVGADQPLIGVILGSPSQAQRSTDVARMLARARVLLQ